MRLGSFLLCALLLTAGCAGRFERVLAEISTAQEALGRFGPPAREEVLPGALLRREWTVQEDQLVPGQYVRQDIYTGTDREGYPEVITRHVFVPEHTLQYRCLLTLVSDSKGELLERRWQGNACERLLARAGDPAPR
ncbi:MAG: hypothetical protein LBJ82_02825 [Deltaproteobacteria bacterium]|jgi:hypothetical protein|nr:hypothetical protein [Deltaproteobacteria bacterium]